MSGLALLLLGIVLAVLAHHIHHSCPLAERVIDTLYRCAHRVDALARSAEKMRGKT